MAIHFRTLRFRHLQSLSETFCILHCFALLQSVLSNSSTSTLRCIFIFSLSQRVGTVNAFIIARSYYSSCFLCCDVLELIVIASHIVSASSFYNKTSFISSWHVSQACLSRFHTPFVAGSNPSQSIIHSRIQSDEAITIPLADTLESIEEIESASYFEAMAPQSIKNLV